MMIIVPRLVIVFSLFSGMPYSPCLCEQQHGEEEITGMRPWYATARVGRHNGLTMGITFFINLHVALCQFRVFVAENVLWSLFELRGP
jgi:hypothetical protein